MRRTPENALADTLSDIADTLASVASFESAKEENDGSWANQLALKKAYRLEVGYSSAFVAAQKRVLDLLVISLHSLSLYRLGMTPWAE